MLRAVVDGLRAQLAAFDAASPDFAAQCVERILAAAQQAGASDIHLQPGESGLELTLRIDGLLTPLAQFPKAVAANITARIKVLAGLLTYHTDRPQEGRLRQEQNQTEMRVCTFPTLHGERTVIRLFGGAQQFQHFADLGLPDDVRIRLERLLAETSGAILVSGPAGSGKTTTAYAAMREIARAAGHTRSLVSIEDPIEAAIAGVGQSQVNNMVGLDLAVGLRFLMRQDPEVILVGEIRDRATAEAAMQASLTGHLLLSTFHAGSAAETVGRLLDMAIEPYILRSGLLAIVNQRLLRRLCRCARPATDDQRQGLPVTRSLSPVGCDACGQSGYQGRFLLAEMLTFSRDAVARAILDRAEAAVIERLAIESGMQSRWQQALAAIEAGMTSAAEVRRVLGFSAGGPP